DDHLLGSALLAEASVLAWAGRRAEAVPVLERVVEVADGSDLGLRAQVQLGSVLRELQRYPQAGAVLRDALTVAGQRGAVREQAIALGALGAISMETGDSDDAVARY